MKIVCLFLLCGFTFIFCNSSKENNPQSISVAQLSGKTFINTDTAVTLAGLHFENDSIMQPLYKVTFDTLFIWKYKIINNSLYRYTTATNKLIAKDSIINITNSVLLLGSFTPDTKQKITFKLKNK